MKKINILLKETNKLLRTVEVSDEMTPQLIVEHLPPIINGPLEGDQFRRLADGTLNNLADDMDKQNMKRNENNRSRIYLHIEELMDGSHVAFIDAGQAMRLGLLRETSLTTEPSE